jgi:hypothetical protein
MFPQRVLGLLCVVGCLFAGACKQPPTASGPPAYMPTGNEGRISGVITLDGKAPAAKSLSMNADPVCNVHGSYTTEEVVAHNGKLQNVFVYVKSGLPAGVTFPAAQTEVALHQQGCRYVPHVLGLHTAATLAVSSKDDTTHNVHPKPTNNREWDGNILPGAESFKKQFRRAEIMIPVKCGIHNWMSAYIGVLDHPFFAVTDANGQYTLAGLPPGEYEIETWHEVYKTQSRKVNVTAQGEAKTDFTYNPATAYQPGQLVAQPAVILP